VNNWNGRTKLVPHYTCKKCNAGMHSKNPVTRSIFLDNQSIALLGAILSVKKEADPHRNGQFDLVVRLSLWNEDKETLEQAWDKLVKRTQYFNDIAEVEKTTPEEMKKQFFCGLDGGHEWHSPDPPEC
jgi:hypothetical protein